MLPAGAADAIVFTVTESISLHRNEMPGGERTRALIVHDMRHSAIQLAQFEGRYHRDGEKAMIYFAFAESTVARWRPSEQVNWRKLDTILRYFVFRLQQSLSKTSASLYRA